MMTRPVEIIATDAANKADFALGIRVFSTASASNMKSTPLDDNRRWDLRRGKDGPNSGRMADHPEVTLAIEGLCRDFSALVIRSPKREGRIRSAERTEVHLIETIRFYELTFCP